MNRWNFNKTLYMALLLLFSGASLASTSHSWNFKVFLSNKEIGRHSFVIKPADEKTYVHIKADFDVNFLFFNAYDYQHRNREIWESGCLYSIQSETNDNGKKYSVKATRLGSTLTIETRNGIQKTKGCIKSFAYWDPTILESQYLLNSQTGEILPIRSEYLGEEIINVKNKPTPARHFRLDAGEFSVDLWYSQNNEWLALHSTVQNGSVLRYEIQ